MNKIKHLISNLKQNHTFKNVLYWALIVSVFLYVFSIPSFSGRAKWFIISYVFMAVLAILTITYTFFYSTFKVNKIIIVPFVFIAFAFLGTALFSHEFRSWLTLVLMGITMMVFYYAFNAIGNKRIVLKILVFAFTAFSLYFIFVYRNNLRSGRLGDYFDNVNTIGFYFSLAFSLAFYIGLLYERKRELLYLIVALLFFVLGFLTGSRAFILVVAMGVFSVLYFKMKKRKLLYLLIVAVLIGLFFVLINIPALSFLKDQFERMMFTLFGIGNSKVDTSTIQRIIYPQYAWFLAGKNMITGYGCGGFAIYSGVGTYAHNNYAEVVCDFGVIGLIIYYLSFIIPMLYSFKPKSKDTFVVIVLVVIYLMRSFFGVTYYTKDSYLVLGLCFYLCNDCRIVSFQELFNKNKTANDYCEVSI